MKTVSARQLLKQEQVDVQEALLSSEESYRRGFHQASFAAYEMIRAGMTLKDFSMWERNNRKWRSALRPRKDGSFDRTLPEWPAR